MKRMPGSVLFVCGLFLIALATGCSDDDPAQPETYEGLVGRVVDADGEPLADVAVGVVYDFPGMIQGDKNLIVAHPLEKPATAFQYDLPEDGHLRLWITDHAGDHVSTLVDEVRTAGSGHFAWTGIDDDDNPVPSGMYEAHVEVESILVAEYEFFLLFLDPADFLTAPNAVTGTDGRFRIPDSLIPVGETLTAVGEEEVTATVSDTLRVLAVVGGDPGPVWTEATIAYREGAENSGIELRLR